ncbi:MAG TPA: spherulation-specific family 4 protein [Polyangiaceae bacterium]|nr:spherulation-specific family 4 protein [Polyangiaceae bacterium]
MRSFALVSALGLTALAGACQSDGGSPANAGGSGAAVAGAAVAGTSTAAGSGSGGTSNGGSSAGSAGSQTSAGTSVGGSSASGMGSGGTAGTAPPGEGGVAGAGDGAAGHASVGNGCIVPLYSYPDAPAWSALVKAKQAHPNVDVIAIVNPDSGPGANVDAAFTDGIAKLVAADIVPIGYVSTNYTKRDQSAVNGDTDQWHELYPAVQGIFFDEQSSQSGDEYFYSAVAGHARTQALDLSVGNPGTGVPNSFLSTVDVMLVYESAGTPTLNSLQKYASNRERYGIIPYAAALDVSFVKSATQSVRYVYLTDDDLPNPWDSLPSYFDDLLAALSP